MHHLVRVLEAGGETAAAQLVAKLGGEAEIARELAYRLYTVCERKSARKKHSPTTAWSKAGRRLCACRTTAGGRNRPSLNYSNKG